MAQDGIMSGLKQELGLAQGVGLLSTSLLGTGVFAVPALAALVAGDNSLWAWPCSFCWFSDRHRLCRAGPPFPSAGGVAHFVDMAFGPRLERVTGWLFLSVIPVGLPAALHIATGFGRRCLAGMTRSCCWPSWVRWHRLVGRFARRQLQRQPANAGCRADCRADRRHLVGGGIRRRSLPGAGGRSLRLFAALSVMFWCFVGLEAFAHLASEFKQPERDFPAR
jgi:amino acid efflux transporter